jgi:hypothetical protein
MPLPWKITWSHSARIKKYIILKWANFLIILTNLVDTRYLRMVCMLPVLNRTSQEYLHICQNPGQVDEEILYLHADRIEAYYPRGIKINIRKLKQSD